MWAFARQPNKTFGDGVIKARPVLLHFDQFALVGDLSLRESPALTRGNFLARVILRRRLLDSGQLAVLGCRHWAVWFGHERNMGLSEN